jgi:hypothetical protein
VLFESYAISASEWISVRFDEFMPIRNEFRKALTDSWAFDMHCAKVSRNHIERFASETPDGGAGFAGKIVNS